MRLLLTSDSQADFLNLDLCEKSLDEFIDAIHTHKPDAVVHGGDLKEALNPVDIRVVKFWVKAVRRIVETGVKLYINLGNHDQIGQSIDSTNWLDVLRAAGARIATKPRVFKIRCADSSFGLLSFLPYTRDKKKELRWARKLAAMTASEVGAFARISTSAALSTVLVFHTEVADAAINAAGTKLKGNTAEDLQMSRYTVCLGGHIHRFGKVADNAWYIGSPFTQDWGEAGQRKGLVLWDSVGQKPKQLVTSIPHWYDADTLIDAYPLEPGALIRSRVEVTSKKITQQLAKEEVRLRRLYPEARLHVVPVVIQSEKLEVELSGATDEDKIAQYIAATSPEAVKFDLKDAVAYVASKLSAIRPSAQESQLKLLKIEAQNVLPFKEIKFSYAKRGLVLLRGVNEDWPKRSNGSGKTSLLSLLLVALFGRTTKNQVNDQWALESTSDRAVVKVTLRDGKRRKLEITRQRRPHGLWLAVDSVDQSTGLSGKGRTETQGQIEEMTGFDLHTLLNSVYIDQTTTNGFVFGSQKSRMDLISKLCDLERFEMALGLVVRDGKQTGLDVLACTRDVEKMDTQKSSIEADLAEVAEELGESTPWTAQAIEFRKKLKALKDEKAGLGQSQSFYDELQREVDAAKTEAKDVDKKLITAKVSVKQVTLEAQRVLTLLKAGNCPQCGQPTTEAIGKQTEVLQKKLLAEEASFKRLSAALESLNKTATTGQTKLNAYYERIEKIDSSIEINEEKLAQAMEGEKLEETRTKRLKAKRSELKEKYKFSLEKLSDLRKQLKALSVKTELLEYAQKALHRSGMPLYLAASLCPLLNRMAREYSELFCGGKLTVQFSVVDGEFIVEVINPSGSESTEGQSVGERATAGVIAAFAVREAAPRTNVLIMDEPGHGLDPVGCKDFARGLIRLRNTGRFDTIIVTTHSPIIESVLVGEEGVSIWTVRKKNGIAVLEQ